MKKRFAPVAAAALCALALLAVLPGGRPATAQGNCQTFKETGKTVCGAFLKYWSEHGALRQQGFPISNEFQEVSATDGKTYTVQYFERAVFELHPENKPPFDVLLSLLGAMAMKEKYPSGPPASPTASNPQGAEYFPQTKQSVYGEFLDYWKANGGLAQQGYPISGRFTEKSDLDGKLYTVQYFERAVFELHPENDPANRVLLSQLGAARFKKLYPNGEPVPGGLTPLAVGRWGGNGVAMDVRPDGAYLEFNCAHANIITPLAARGSKLDVAGIYVQEHGGPVLVDENAAGRPARFTGLMSQDGKSLKLTITYTDDNSVIGTFDLIFGNTGKIMKCL